MQGEKWVGGGMDCVLSLRNGKYEWQWVNRSRADRKGERRGQKV